MVYEHVLGGSHYSEGGGDLDDILGGGCGNWYSHKLDILHMSQ